jgi:carotenoid cleavage dioxygenase-like enzyme
MNPPLPIDGVLPPDLQGTLLRIGPGVMGGVDEASEGRMGSGERHGALHAIELRDGAAVTYLTSPSSADANVFWHAGKVLALAESSLPQQFSRLLQPEEFDGGLTVPVASHVHRDATTGGRILFGVERGTEESSPFIRLGEWDASGALIHHREVELERDTWQHDLAVTARHIVFIESPTEFSPYLAPSDPRDGDGDGGGGNDGGGDPGDPERPAPSAIPFRWTPGAPGWLGVLDRAGTGGDLRWIRLDPCLVTHVLHAYDDGDAVVLYVCRYEVPE